MPTDRGRAQPCPPRDRVIVQTLGHQLEHRLLSRGRPVGSSDRTRRRERRGPIPQQLEVLAQRGNDDWCTYHQRSGDSRERQREQRGGLVRRLHPHRHTRQQPRLLSARDAGSNDPPGHPVIHRRGLIDGTAGHLAAERW